MYLCVHCLNDTKFTNVTYQYKLQNTNSKLKFFPTIYVITIRTNVTNSSITLMASTFSYGITHGEAFKGRGLNSAVRPGIIYANWGQSGSERG